MKPPPETTAARVPERSPGEGEGDHLPPGRDRRVDRRVRAPRRAEPGRRRDGETMTRGRPASGTWWPRPRRQPRQPRPRRPGRRAAAGRDRARSQRGAGRGGADDHLSRAARGATRWRRRPTDTAYPSASTGWIRCSPRTRGRCRRRPGLAAAWASAPWCSVSRWAGWPRWGSAWRTSGPLHRSNAARFGRRDVLLERAAGRLALGEFIAGTAMTFTSSDSTQLRTYYRDTYRRSLEALARGRRA